MADIRIPTEFLLELVDNLREHPEAAEMTFEHMSGNTLVAKRVRGPRSRGGGEYDSWDFEYNPGD